MKFGFVYFLENLSRKFKFHENLKRITGFRIPPSSRLHTSSHHLFVIPLFPLISWQNSALCSLPQLPDHEPPLPASWTDDVTMRLIARSTEFKLALF
jgi:hypothetical protein